MSSEFERHTKAWKSTLERFVFRMGKGVKEREGIDIALQSLKMEYQLDSALDTEKRLGELMKGMFTDKKESQGYNPEQLKVIAARAADCVEQVARELQNEEPKIVEEDPGQSVEESVA